MKSEKPRAIPALYRSALAALLLVLSTPAWGQEEATRADCATLFATGPKLRYTIDRLDPLLTDQHVTEITDVLNRTVALVAPHLEVPDAMRLRLKYRDREASASLNGGVLNLPYQITSAPGQNGSPARFKAPRHTHPVMAHEMGHAIFAKNIKSFTPKFRANLAASMRAYMLRKYPPFDETIAAVQRLRGTKAQLEKAYRAQLDDWGNGGDPELKAQITRTDNLIHELMMKLPKDPLAGFNTIDFRVAYEELFADVVAVSVMQNPRAVYSSIFPMSTSDAAARSRDFLRPMAAESWHRGSVHNLYGPARFYLSQDPRSVKLFRADPGRLTKVVYDAIIQDLEDLSHEAYRIPQLTVKERNERLIERLKAKLAEALPDLPDNPPGGEPAPLQ